MQGKAEKQISFIEQLSRVEGDFGHHVEVASFLFGGIVDRGSESEIIEALAALMGLQTLSYAMLRLSGFNLDSLRQKAEALVHGAVELNNLREVR